MLSITFANTIGSSDVSTVFTYFLTFLTTGPVPFLLNSGGAVKLFISDCYCCGFAYFGFII